MKHFQSAMLFSLVAFIFGAASTSSVAQIFGAGGHIHAVARHGAAHMRPIAAAPTHDGDVVSTSDLSNGSVEEYAGDGDGPGGQGSGYGDVYDQNGHLLWRFAVLEGDKSKWTIFKYFPHSGQEPRDSKSADPAPEPGKSGSP